MKKFLFIAICLLSFIPFVSAKKVTINLMDTEEPTIQIYNSNSKNKRRKSFDKKSYRKTSENKKNNNKKTFKTKSHNKSPIFNNNKIFPKTQERGSNRNPLRKCMPQNMTRKKAERNAPPFLFE